MDAPHTHDDDTAPHSHDGDGAVSIPPSYLINSLSAQLSDATFRIAVLEAQLAYHNDMAAAGPLPEVPSAP